MRELTAPGGLTEVRSSVTVDSATGNRTEAVQYAVPGGSVVSESSRVYTNLPWGLALVSETLRHWGQILSLDIPG